MAIIGPLSYTGGLNSTASPYNLPNNQLVTLSGCEILYNNITNTRGNDDTTTSDAAIGGSATSTYSIGVFGQKLAVVINGPAIYTSTDQGASWSDATGAITPSATPYQNWAVLNSLLITSNNTNGNLLKWSGSGNFALLGGTPPTSITCLKVVNNFLFTGAGSTVRWSAVADPETWPAGSTLTFRGGDGDIVAAFGSIGTDLYIFKHHSIGRLSTTTSTVSGTATLGPLVTVSDRIGCASNLGVDNTPDGRIVFAGSDNHIYLFDGSSFSDISDQSWPGPNIQSALDGDRLIPVANGVGFSSFWIVKTDYARARLIVEHNTTSDPVSVAYIYSYEKNCWALWDRCQESFADFQTAVTQPVKLLSGKSGHLYRESEGLSINGATPNNHTATVSVRFTQESRGFVPKSIIIPYASAGSNTITVTLGWDKNLESSSKTLPDPTSSGIGRYVLPINTWKSTYETLQIKFVASIASNGGNFAIYPLYISDEVAS